MLRLEGVTKSFGDKRAVDQVSLVVPTGQLVGVIGRSGAGKSTLLRMINRLGDPSRGRILFGDTDITALKGRALRQWRARCAMIFQQFNLAGRLDVLNNVMMGRAFHVPASAAAKAGIEAFARAMAVDLAPSGATANCVAPGLIEKDADAHAALSRDRMIEMSKLVPIGRYGKTAEVAAVIAFLCSPGAGYVTGQTIHVNGGLTL